MVMEMTQQDFEARKRRVDAGIGTDEDARLVKLYEREGYEAKPAADAGDVSVPQEGATPGAPPAAGDDVEPDDGSTAHGRGRGAGRTARAK